MAIKPELVTPGKTAIVINECQRLVVGDLSMLPELVKAAAPILGNIGRLVRAARAVNIQVVHGVVLGRSDGRGANTNTRMNAAAKKHQAASTATVHFDPAAGAEIPDEIGTEPSDIILPRSHGMSPMTETGLDPILRNLGVSTIVACGVSLNIGLTNTVMDAVNRSYNVVVPRDCAAGVPTEYGEAVLENTIANLARLTTADELCAIWAAG